MVYVQKTASQDTKNVSDKSVSSAISDQRESTQTQLKQQGIMHAACQRVLIPHKPKSPTTSEETIAGYYAGIIDELVTMSYEEFMKGDYDGASASQIALYKRRKYEFDEAKRIGGSYSMHPSTAAGYVIEGKANSKILSVLSNVELQVSDILDGTRPDIVFKINDTGLLGMVDITASNSAGHIFSKKGNWTGHKDIIHVSEAVYPSIDFDSMKPIVLSSEDVELIKEKANEKELIKQEQFDYWRDLYAQAQSNVLNSVKHFNSNNKTPFKGTQTQLLKVITTMRKFGLGAMFYPDNTQINDIVEISFEDQDGVDLKLKTPYKIDVASVKNFIAKLNQGDMVELFK